MAVSELDRVGAENLLGADGITTTQCSVEQWSLNTGQRIQTITSRINTQNGAVIGSSDDPYADYISDTYSGGEICSNTGDVGGYYYVSSLQSQETTSTGAYEVFNMVTIAALIGIVIVIIGVCWLVAKRWFHWHSQEVTEDDNIVWYENRGKQYWRFKTPAEKRGEA